MTKSEIPANAYTYSPEQHPNLIVGSFQLLFWMMFRREAWESHLERINPLLNNNNTPWQLVDNQLWGLSKVRRFLVQGYILLPALFGILTGLTLLSVTLLFFFNSVKLSEHIAYSLVDSVFLGIYWVMNGVFWGAVGGVAFGTTYGLAGGVAFSVAYNIVYILMQSVLPSFPRDIWFQTMTSASYFIFGVAFGVTSGTAGGVTYGMAFGLLFGSISILLGGVSLGLGILVNWWRPIVLTGLLLPWHWLLYRIDRSRNRQLPSLLYRHLAFWDDWQYLPILGLDKHLLLTLEKRPLEGQAALDYVSVGRQRWAAQAAQIELDARQLERCNDAVVIGQIHRTLTVGEMQGPADALLRSFTRISNDVSAALSQESTYNQRLALSSIVDRLDRLVRELTRSSDKYAARFRPIAQRWVNIVALTIEDLTKESEQRQEIDSPYIIGVPLNQQQAVFIGRTDISVRIEQLLLDRRCPPLLLYGQRRTGKTSLLNNLGQLLPQSVIPLFVDLQGPASRAKDNTGFLYNLTKEMIRSAQEQRSLTLPPVTRQDLAGDPFTVFDEWLDNVEIAMDEGNTTLLALDEFEVLDKALVDGRFNETDVLGMLRNLIQNRPRFKVMIAGSHTLKEFQRWSSYLINAQVIHLGYLKEPEARQLIEHPIKDFALRYEPDASQRVLDVTHGHPFLVQLLCGEIVAYKNEQDPSVRRLATLADVEVAIPEALEHGSMFFSDIEGNQVDGPALAILQHIAAQGEGGTVSKAQLAQHADELDPAIDLLLRRELIEETADGYRFQVELIRRWFA